MRIRLRKLRIGERDFTWRAEICHVPGELDCHRGIRLRVWGAGKTGRALQADLVSTASPAPWGACATDDAYPCAADVAAVITCGLAHGWDADTLGGTFVLTEHATALELPGFLLTDRLRRTCSSGDHRYRRSMPRSSAGEECVRPPTAR